MLVESYSRTRWLDKLRPAGTPHRWMGRGGRWHLSWPLADTTAQKKKLTTFLDSCMSSLRVSMLFFSVSFKRETLRIMFVILTQGPCSPVLVLTWRSSYADTVGEGVKTGKSSGQCTVEIPVQSTAREFHTSLPYRRTSPLVNNFLNPAIHSSKLHTHKKKKRRVISGAHHQPRTFHPTETRCGLGFRAGCLLFNEALPSELVPAHLPVLHDNWSSIRSLRDADFEKTGDVLLKGLPCSSQITRNRKEDTTLVTASSVAAISKELTYLVGCKCEQSQSLLQPRTSRRLQA